MSCFLHGEFLTRQRVRLWALGLLIAFAASLAFLAVTSDGLSDFRGRPLGTDFSDVYTAGMLVRDGAAASAYDPVPHYQQQQALFGFKTPFYGWHYPPFFLSIAGVLAYVPYIPALLVWLVASMAAYMVAMRALQRQGPVSELLKDRMWLLLVAAFPAVFVNIIHGQNGFLTAALAAGGLAFLDRRPLVSGVLFGLLAYKPQFAILPPFLLMLTGRWRTLGAAAATVLLLVVASTALFGAEIWRAFLGSSDFSRTFVLEQGNTGFEKIQSVFAAVRLMGGSIAAAYAVQGVVAVIAAASVAVLWRGSASMELKGAGLCIATLLVTPYCLDYDLMLLAPAIALLIAEGRARGWLAGEQLMIAGLWVMPFAARVIAGATHIPVGSMLIALSFALIARRATHSRLVPLPNLT